MGLAAVALYVACVLEGENKTQKDVAEAAGVTKVTIRNRYKGLKAALKPWVKNLKKDNDEIREEAKRIPRLKLSRLHHDIMDGFEIGS